MNEIKSVHKYTERGGDLQTISKHWERELVYAASPAFKTSSGGKGSITGFAPWPNGGGLSKAHLQTTSGPLARVCIPLLKISKCKTPKVSPQSGLTVWTTNRTVDWKLCWNHWLCECEQWLCEPNPGSSFQFWKQKDMLHTHMRQKSWDLFFLCINWLGKKSLIGECVNLSLESKSEHHHHYICWRQQDTFVTSGESWSGSKRWFWVMLWKARKWLNIHFWNSFSTTTTLLK